MGVEPEKVEVVLQKREKKKKNKRDKKIKMDLVEAISFSGETTTREVGDNRVGLMMDNKQHKRKVKKEKRVESIKESELNVILEKDVVNGKDHLGGKKKKRKLEPNERNNELECISMEETDNGKKEKGDELKKNKCKERKKEKRDKGEGVVSSTSVAVLMDKRKVKKEKRVESIKDSELNVILEKDVVNGKDQLGGKKKKRKLESNERNNELECISMEETDNGKKEKGDELKKNKCKERKKEKRDKGEGVVSSTSVAVFMDKEEGNKETNGLRQSEKEDLSNTKEYESEHEKQTKMKNKKMKGLEHCEKKRKTKKLDKKRKEFGDCEGEDIGDTKEWKQGDEERKKQEKKDNRLNESRDIEIPKMKCPHKVSGKEKRSIVRSQEFEKEADSIDGSSEQKVEYKKKGGSRGTQEKNHIEGCSREVLIENLTGDGKAIPEEIAYTEGRPGSIYKKRGREKGVIDDEMEKREKNYMKMTKLVNDVEEKRVDEGNFRTKDRGGSTSDHSKDFESKKSSKRVKFSGHVEVFPSSDPTDVGEEHEEQKLVQGKRFSKKEDQMIIDAVNNYIKVHGLGENGLDMVLNCKSCPETRNCWKEIATALPWRPLRTIYWRAHNLLTRGELRSWTEEDKALIMKFRNEHGPDWTKLAKVLGKHRIHLKDKWRHIRCANLKKGHWSQDEYQTLFELVNLDLQMKVHEEKNTKHGMLRDNISWTAISDKLGTRSSNDCCRKWYHGLSSSMVKSGEWDNSDDYRLLNELLRLDACSVEDVDWDNLVDQRSGEVCLTRWKQMCLHIGNHGIKPFAEQVEVLAKRYCPSLLEVRETLDSRPIVE